MPTNYPVGRDEFGEPSSPDQTPLSSAGTSTRNHVEHHRDLGDAVEALQANAATTSHDHSGVPDSHGVTTAKLKQVNTHEGADTDTSKNAIHHTLGKGPHQAASGNHTHDFNSPEITNKPFQVCLSTERPTSPIVGAQIFESDTGTVRAWYTPPGEEAPRWVLLPVANRPIVRLSQTTGQRILAAGSPLEWGEVEEDPMSCFSTSNLAEVVVPEAGLYNICASIAWNPTDVFGDHAYTTIRINGQRTRYIHSEFVRGNIFKPGFSQTVSVEGLVRLAAGDRVEVWGSHNGAFAQWTYSSTSNFIKSRLDIVYLAP